MRKKIIIGQKKTKNDPNYLFFLNSANFIGQYMLLTEQRKLKFRQVTIRKIP